NTDDPVIAERTARTCLLAPEALTDLAPVFRLGDRAVTGTEKHPDYWWFTLAKGLGEYRAGHYDAAIDWLNRVYPRADGGHWDAQGFAVLAMAKRRQGLVSGADAVRFAEEALAALGHAQAILAKMPDPKAGRPFGDGWQDWLHAHILCREAETLLGMKEE